MATKAIIMSRIRGMGTSSGKSWFRRKEEGGRRKENELQN
jgi:hypothetical protein